MGRPSPAIAAALELCGCQPGASELDLATPGQGPNCVVGKGSGGSLGSWHCSLLAGPADSRRSHFSPEVRPRGQGWGCQEHPRGQRQVHISAPMVKMQVVSLPSGHCWHLLWGSLGSPGPEPSRTGPDKAFPVTRSGGTSLPSLRMTGPVVRQPLCSSPGHAARAAMGQLGPEQPGPEPLLHSAPPAQDALEL